MKNWAIFVDGVFHSRYKQRADADGHAAFLRETTGKRVVVLWDVEASPADRMAIVGAALIVLCGTGAIVNRPVSAYEQGTYGYNQGGTITVAEAESMQNYAPNQSYHAITSHLGYPKYRSRDADIYEIAGTGDVSLGGVQVRPNQRFIVVYAASPSCNYECSQAIDWYWQ
jgi:hypothetical protein